MSSRRGARVPAPRRPRARAARAAAAVLAALLAAALVAGCESAGPAERGSASNTPTSAAPVTPSGSLPFGRVPEPGVAPSSGARTVSPPVHLRIPSIGVDTSLVRLGLLRDGTLAAPKQWQQAGWYAGGTLPGTVGPAVIAGHVDSTAGPAVFFRLRDLQRGDRVLVRRADGTTLTFVVDARHRYPKARFPTSAVYGATPDPQLRLITCAGDFDTSARSYRDNLVVAAHLAG